MHSPSAPSRQTLRILVVEDHTQTLESLVRCLTRLGHFVTHAQSMEAALAIFQTAGCGVLLSDIGLPDGDGWELLRRITALLPPERPLYAIAMSGYGERGDFEKSRAAGFRHHLVKPFRTAELVTALESAPANPVSAPA